MTHDSVIRIDLTADDKYPVGQSANKEAETHQLGFQVLEHRYMPLVVIAIIAVLFALLIPS